MKKQLKFSPLEIYKILTYLYGRLRNLLSFKIVSKEITVVNIRESQMIVVNFHTWLDPKITQNYEIRIAANFFAVSLHVYVLIKTLNISRYPLT